MDRGEGLGLDQLDQTLFQQLEHSHEGHHHPLTTLGDIYMAKEQQDEACDCYEKAIALDPEDAQAYLSLAELYYDRGQLEEAEQSCLKGLKLDAGLPMGYLLLGYVYLDQDRNQESIDNFQQFLRLEKNPDAKQIRDEVAAVIDGLK